MATQAQWEYLFVHVGLARGFSEATWKPYSINDRPLSQWERGPTWQEYFQSLGDQGWEFVTFEDRFLSNPVIGGKIAVFKRLRSAVPIKQLKRETATEAGALAPFVGE